MHSMCCELKRQYLVHVRYRCYSNNTLICPCSRVCFIDRSIDEMCNQERPDCNCLTCTFTFQAGQGVAAKVIGLITVRQITPPVPLACMLCYSLSRMQPGVSLQWAVCQCRGSHHADMDSVPCYLSTRALEKQCSMQQRCAFSRHRHNPRCSQRSP